MSSTRRCIEFELRVEDVVIKRPSFLVGLKHPQHERCIFIACILADRSRRHFVKCTRYMYCPPDATNLEDDDLYNNIKKEMTNPIACLPFIAIVVSMHVVKEAEASARKVSALIKADPT